MNGRGTGNLGIRLLVKNKTYRASAANTWSCCENNATNAYNVNLSTGQVNNNNNKSTSYQVRPVAALDTQYMAGWVEAYDDFCSKKMTSVQCTLIRLRVEHVLTNIAREVLDGLYQPTTSTAFPVNYPTLREIFAAHRRDRLVHHWVELRLEPLFEMRFRRQGNVSFNCRKGFGTVAAVLKLQQDIKDVSCNYTKEAYAVRYDLSGFFMSIDCNILIRLLNDFVRTNWHIWDGTDYQDDLALTLRLAETIIRHEPEKNCIRQGNFALWRTFPPNKTLFGRKPMTGMPIGNLPSQHYANFYMSYYDDMILQLIKRCGGRYTRFVDDPVCVCGTRRECVELWKWSGRWLADNLHLKLHPKKMWIQEVRKGVPFLGYIIKPWGIYKSNRTIGGLYNAVRHTDSVCRALSETPQSVELAEELRHAVASVNSYMGFLAHCLSYSVRRKALSSGHDLWKCCSTNPAYSKLKIYNKYKLRTILLWNKNHCS